MQNIAWNAAAHEKLKVRMSVQRAQGPRPSAMHLKGRSCWTTRVPKPKGSANESPSSCCISRSEQQKVTHTLFVGSKHAARVHLSSSRTGSSRGPGVCDAELYREGDLPATTTNMVLTKVSSPLTQVIQAHMAERTVLCTKWAWAHHGSMGMLEMQDGSPGLCR